MSSVTETDTHLLDAPLLHQVLQGLHKVADAPQQKTVVDAQQEVAIAQQVMSTPLAVGRHRSEATKALKLDVRNVLRPLAYTGTLVAVFTFIYQLTERAIS